MKLVVLGSGTCVPSALRSSSGYWVESAGCTIRLDCGEGSIHAMGRFGLDWESLSHQFISHFHIDHAGALAALLFALKYGRSKPRKAPFRLLGPVGLKRVLEGIEVSFRQALTRQEFPVEVQELEPGDRIELAPETWLSVTKTPHTAESLAVRIDSPDGSIGYTGDTAESEELSAFFQGLDVLVAECSTMEPARFAHLSADELSSMAQNAAVRHLVASHFYFDPDAEGLEGRLKRGYQGSLSIARDGLEVFIP